MSFNEYEIRININILDSKSNKFILNWPLQQIVNDLFYNGHFAYFICINRLTRWLIL